jgi:gliding motility-associated-like protein
MMIGTSYAQQIELDRQLIGSGYTEYDNGSDFTFSASLGEPLTITRVNTNLILSEGFQQSNYVLSDPLIAQLSVDSAACIGANDGAITVSFVSDKLTEPLVYQWSNGATTESATGLVVGTYSVTITGANGLSVTNSARVSPIDSIDCTPGFYTGITPNNDGDNDYWHVDNAFAFSTKEVSIFNRYGALVWETDDYNNTNNSFTGLHRNGQPLPVGTYYFIAKFDDSNYKGWIEISR